MQYLVKQTIRLALFTLVMASGCKLLGLNSSDGRAPMNWETASYEIEQMLICFCGPPAGEFQKLKVVNDQIVEINGKEPTTLDLQALKTVKLLQEFIDGINPDSVAVYRVSYDETYGFPDDVYIDFDSRIADEEIGYMNRNLKLLK